MVRVKLMGNVRLKCRFWVRIWLMVGLKARLSLMLRLSNAVRLRVRARS